MQPEHALAYALHYYRIVDREKALVAIEYAAEELLMRGLCDITLDGDNLRCISRPLKFRAQ